MPSKRRQKPEVDPKRRRPSGGDEVVLDGLILPMVRDPLLRETLRDAMTLAELCGENTIQRVGVWVEAAGKLAVYADTAIRAAVLLASARVDRRATEFEDALRQALRQDLVNAIPRRKRRRRPAEP